MKTMFCVCAMAVTVLASIVRGGEFEEPTSVLVAPQPAPAVVKPDRVEMYTGATGSSGSAGASGVCVNGNCNVGRPYNVTESCTGSCRNRLMGGYVEKATSRKVYRPARRR